MNDGAYPLTNSDPDPTSFEALTDDAGDYNGISITWSGEDVSGSCETSSFTAKIMCANASTQPDAIIDDVDVTDTCNPVAMMSAPAGCPISMQTERKQMGIVAYVVAAIMVLLAITCLICCCRMCFCSRKDDEDEKKEKVNKEEEGTEMTNNANNYDANVVN